MAKSKEDQLCVKGAWWDATAPDQRFFGELRVDDSGRPSLALEKIALRSREEVIGLADDRLVSRIYHGHDQHGRPYSLFGCVRANTSRSAAYVARRQSVSIAVQGLQCGSPDEVTLDNVTVDFTDLQEWLCTPMLRKVDDPEGRIVIQKPSLEEKVHKTAQGFSVALRPWVGGWSSAEGECVSFKQSLDLRFDQPANLRVLGKIIHALQGFLTLGIGKPVDVLSVAGTRKGHVVPGTDLPDRIEIYQQWRSAGETWQEHQRWDMLFTAPDLTEGLGAALDRWHTYGEKHHAVLACYFSTLFNRHLYSNHEFLFLAHALELYHQLNCDGSYQSSADFTARLDRITQKVTEEAGWLRQRLAGANRKTLADRLVELLTSKAALLGEFISEPAKFAGRIKDTRNYYTHYDDSLKRNGRVAEGVELLKLTNQMRSILEAFFLHDLGAPQAAIKKVLRDDRTYIAAP